MKHFSCVFSLLAAWTVLAAVPASASTEATFQRDMVFSGRLDLKVATGSGAIHLATGPAGHIHIFARVKSGNWCACDAKVREIAANPPIQQTGNIVRIGGDHVNFNNVSIDYEIEAPPDAYLDAATGSGNIFDQGVGASAKLSTGSGNIQAAGLQGSFIVHTGSGNIDASQAGAGDVKASTGSGTIVLKSIHGGLEAGTGSGNIKIDGTPSASWRLHTGSGGIELWTGGAGVSLDASTGSGGIHCDRQLASQTTFEHHHVKGIIGGGGPLVRISTGSGNIRVH